MREGERKGGREGGRERGRYERAVIPLQAIEEGSLDMLDNSDFANTDIPFEVPLPEKPFMTVILSPPQLSLPLPPLSTPHRRTRGRR